MVLIRFQLGQQTNLETLWPTLGTASALTNVEVFGLASEASKDLNRQSNDVTEGRYVDGALGGTPGDFEVGTSEDLCRILGKPNKIGINPS